MKKTLLLFLIIIHFGCNETSKKANNELEWLRHENENLKLELEDLKFGSKRLLAQAKNYINDNNFEKAKNDLDYLLFKHPDSPQVKEADSLKLIVESKLNEKKQLKIIRS